MRKKGPCYWIAFVLAGWIMSWAATAQSAEASYQAWWVHAAELQDLLNREAKLGWRLQTLIPQSNCKFRHHSTGAVANFPECLLVVMSKGA